MNKDYEKRMTLVFILTFVMVIGMMFFLPKSKPPVENAPSSAATAVSSQQAVSSAPSALRYSVDGTVSSTNIILSNEGTKVTVETRGGRITSYLIDGKWNRMKEPVSLISTNSSYLPGDMTIGLMESLAADSNRPVFYVLSNTDSYLELQGMVNYRGVPVEIRRSYTLGQNYRLDQTTTLKNLGKTAVKVDENGRALSVSWHFSFFAKDKATTGNILYPHYYNGKDQKQALEGGFLSEPPKVSEASGAWWMTLQDNYFIAAVKPLSTEGSSKFLLLESSGAYKNIAMGLEYPALMLNPDESRSYGFTVYAGPKKEANLLAIDKSYAKLFEYWIVFNWFMKPLEWVILQFITLLSNIIPNYGIVLILMAIAFKLLLSPLSIQSAVSIKKMQALQPKLKKLQEQYKDNPQELNMKMAELYRKEKVNPLSGCWPVLLQMPIIIVLLRVLYNTVEMRGATFLWMNDLTQPDTLFTMVIPFINMTFQFNLMPLLMTGLSLLQMQLQSMKQPGQEGAQKLNMVLFPVIMLFFFYGLPSGLVLYWTMQNILSIAEQELINFTNNKKKLY